MKVYKSGTIIRTVIGDHKGIITSVNIRGSYVSYEMSYFLRGEYYSPWLSEDEFEVLSEEDKKEIGFKNESD